MLEQGQDWRKIVGLGLQEERAASGNTSVSVIQIVDEMMLLWIFLYLFLVLVFTYLSTFFSRSDAVWFKRLIVLQEADDAVGQVLYGYQIQRCIQYSVLNGTQ